MQVLSHADLSPDQLLSAIAGQHPDLRDTWADGGWQLCAIDATRGHSRDRSLMHPCYILIQADDYWVFNHRPHGLLELVLGSFDLSFPCVLPQMINFPVLQAFLSPLLPQGLSCLSLQMRHNGAAVDYQLVSCFHHKKVSHPARGYIAGCVFAKGSLCVARSCQRWQPFCFDCAGQQDNRSHQS